MKEVFALDLLGREHRFDLQPQYRNGEIVDYGVTVSRYESDGRITQLHYQIVDLQKRFDTEAAALDNALKTVSLLYVTPVLG